jgi:predicted alpha/beta-hydrolase family hydrolase
MVDKIEFLFDGLKKATRTIALAHGAGAPMRSEYLAYFAEGLAGHGLRVARFEFPYMAARALGGKKGAPDREPVLRETWHRVVEQLGVPGLVMAGKSMGGRIASLVADECAAGGLVCLGYPFHPVGKPTQLRTAHLATLRTPTLILQGTRDPFGTQEEVGGYMLSSAIQVHWITDGNHDFTPRKASGRTQKQNWDEAIETMATFVAALK